VQQKYGNFEVENFKKTAVLLILEDYTLWTSVADPDDFCPDPDDFCSDPDPTFQIG
jgi:hypothetical protein